MPQDKGAPDGTGSRASTEPQERLGRSGFDPSRDDRGSPERLRNAARWCSGHEPSLSLLQMVAEEAAERIEDAELALEVWDQGKNSEYWLRYPATCKVLLQLRDSDGSPEGEKPQALSAEHESAGLKEASPDTSRETPNATR